MFKQIKRQSQTSKLLLAGLSMTMSVSLVAATVYASNPGTGYTTKGQELNIRIDEAIQGATYTPGEPVTVIGTTSIGPLATETHLLYVVDVSGSTGAPIGQDCNGDGTFDAGDDVNSDGLVGDTLDCEISAVIALNESLIHLDGFSAGIVPFASTAAIADVDPADGEQTFVSSLAADQNNNGTYDLEEVATSLYSGAVTLFTPIGVGGGTSFDAAIRAVNEAFAPISSGTKVALFLSDGHSTVDLAPSSPLAQAKAAGAIIHTYSVGNGAIGCAAQSALAAIASETGGTCTVVSDPAQLTSALTGTPPDAIDRVEVVTDASQVLTTTLNSIGIWNAYVPADLVAFPLPITATVRATDGTTVTANLMLEMTMSIDPIDEPAVDGPAEHGDRHENPSIFLPFVQQ